MLSSDDWLVVDAVDSEIMHTCIVIYKPAVPGLTVTQSRDYGTRKTVGIPGSGIPGLYTLATVV